jgi:hypothetical protein
MSKQTEAMKMALNKVQEFKARWWKVPPFGNKVNKATREAITNAHSPIFDLEHALQEALAEKPAPAQPLTDEQIDEIDEANWKEDHTVWGIREFARAIEAAHGITKGGAA